MNRKLIGAVATLMAMGTLVPVSFAATSSSSAKNAQFMASIALDGKILSSPYGVAAKDGKTTTTYMPLYYLDVALKAAGFSATWDGQTRTWALTTAEKNMDFSSLSVGSGNTSITVNGQLVKKVNTIARIDPAGGKSAVATTYAPIFYVQEIMSAIGIQSTWDGTIHYWSATSPQVVTTGSFGPDSGTQKVTNDIYIKGDGVTLKNLNVIGNVYVDPGADGSAYLNNVTVSGKIVVLSGANHSIHFDGVSADKVDYHSSSPVDTQITNSNLGTITITQGSTTNTVTINVASGTVGNVNDGSTTPVILQGQGYKVVTVSGTSTIEITGKVDSLNITAPGVKVTVDDKASIGTLVVNASAGNVAITNNGTITALTNQSTSKLSVTGTGSVTTSTGSVTITPTTPVATGGGGGGGGFGGGSSTPPTSAEDQDLAILTGDLTAIHDALTPDELKAVQAAEAQAKALSTTDWEGYIYPGQTLSAPQIAAVKALKDIIELSSYGSLENDTTSASGNVQAIMTDISGVYSGMTDVELYNFFESFKTSLLSQAAGILDHSVPEKTAFSNALVAAVTANPEFNGLLGQVGLSIADLSTIYTSVSAKIDPNGDALTAMITAAESALASGNLK